MEPTQIHSVIFSDVIVIVKSLWRLKLNPTIPPVIARRQMWKMIFPLRDVTMTSVVLRVKIKKYFFVDRTTWHEKWGVNHQQVTYFNCQISQKMSKCCPKYPLRQKCQHPGLGGPYRHWKTKQLIFTILRKSTYQFSILTLGFLVSL